MSSAPPPAAGSAPTTSSAHDAAEPRYSTDEPPPAYGYPAGQHPAVGQSSVSVERGGQAPGYNPGEREPGVEATQADLDERELPKGWERCYDGFLGHCFYVYVLSDPVKSTWLHPLDREADAALASTPGATPGASGVEDAEGYFHHDTLGTKIKNLATGKSHEERAKQRAAKHKLMNDQYEAYLRERRVARGEAAATRYPVPTEPYPTNHPSGRYRGNTGIRGNGIGFGQPGLRSMAFLMGYGAIGF